MLPGILLVGCDDQEAERAKRVQASKKAFNTPGVVKAGYAPMCGEGDYGGWSYPLKLARRPISFDAPGSKVRAQVRRGDFWQDLKVNQSSRTLVNGVDAIRFCQTDRYRRIGEFPLSWE